MKKFSLSRSLSALIIGYGALVGFGQVAHAGTWSGPAYTVDGRIPAPPAGTRNDVPSDSFVTNANTGTTASGTVTVVFTWTPAYTNEKAPEAVLIAQTASASWAGASNDTGPIGGGGLPHNARSPSPSYSNAVWHKHNNFRVIPIQQVTYSGGAANGLGSLYIKTKDAQGFDVAGKSSGTKADAYSLAPDHTVTIKDVMLSANVNPSGHLKWSYSASIVQVSLQHSTAWSAGNTFPNTIGNPPYDTPFSSMINDGTPNQPLADHQSSWNELKFQLPQGMNAYLDVSGFNVSTSIHSSLTALDAAGQPIGQGEDGGNRTDPAYPNPGASVTFTNNGDTIFFNDGPGPLTQGAKDAFQAATGADNNIEKLRFG